MNTNDLQAVRAYFKALSIATEGFAEGEAADAGFDAGEFSGAFWASKYDKAERSVRWAVAERFGMSGDALSSVISCYEYQQHLQDLARPRRG